MKMYTLAASLLLFAATPGLALTGPALQQQTDKPAAQADAKTVSGEVVSINTNDNQLVIKDATGKEMQLKTDTTTKVMREGKAITLAELKTNDRVTCECEPTANGWTAKSIQVMPMKASK